jgi:hypothetical protein
MKSLSSSPERGLREKRERGRGERERVGSERLISEVMWGFVGCGAEHRHPYAFEQVVEGLRAGKTAAGINSHKFSQWLYIVIY